MRFPYVGCVLVSICLIGYFEAFGVETKGHMKERSV